MSDLRQTAKPGPSFKPALVRAILNTRPGWPPEPIDASKPIKWQTRRVISDRVMGQFAVLCPGHSGGEDFAVAWREYALSLKLCPYCPGGIYYIREPLMREPFGEAAYASDMVVDFPADTISWHWKRDVLPARFMPRAAARLFIRIRDVQVKRVQDISEADCYAEGCPPRKAGEWKAVDAHEWFMSVWEYINGEASWAANPWVWVYTFERAESEEALIAIVEEMAAIT